MLVTFLVFAAVFLLILALTIIYLYPGSRRVTTVPGLDQSDPKDGNMADIREAGSLHEFLLDLHAKFGDIASFWIGQELVVSVASPQLFKEISHVFDRPASLFMMFEPMISSHSIQYANGAEGRKRRNLYDKSYSHQALTPCYEVIQQSADELLQKLASIPHGDHIPLSQYMLALAIKTIARASFGLYFTDDKQILKLRQSYDICWADMECRLAGSFPEPGSDRQKRFDKNVVVVREVITKAIADRKKKGAPPGEYLFIDALIDSGFSDDVIVADGISFMVGGFHTTGFGLLWAMYFLATHQDIQDKVVEEIRAVLGDKDVSPDTFEDLRYLKQVLNETMRCSLLAPWAARYQDSDSELAGHKIPAGTPVILSFGVIFQDERLYPEPNTFDPDRFEEQAMKSLPNLAFEPFGFAGKRKCPGYRLAYVELAIVLVTLLRTLKFQLQEGQVVVPDYGLVTKPKEEIWVTVSKRT